MLEQKALNHEKKIKELELTIEEKESGNALLKKSNKENELIQSQYKLLRNENIQKDESIKSNIEIINR
jgi:hypothetical protein